MLDPAIKRGIIAGVISWLIILVFLQPLANFLWTITRTVAAEFSKGILDSVYLRAAQGETTRIDLQFLLMFMATWWGFTVGIIVGGLSSRLKPTPSDRDAVAWIRKNSWLLITILIVGAVDGGVYAAKNYAVVQFNVSFRQRLAAIAPYITSQQEKQLLSMWALMKTQQDYTRVNAVLENYARDQNIELPKVGLR
jgi:hypothetical protein